jgi:ferrous iron transport protein A
MLLPLDMLNAGEWADVAEVSGEPALIVRLAELGVREGCRLQVLQPGSPCLLQVDQCKLCLRGNECTQILVRLVGA